MRFTLIHPLCLFGHVFSTNRKGMTYCVNCGKVIK